MPDVTLIPLAEHERDAFVEQQIADYADQQVRDAGWPRPDALGRARAELTPVLSRELAEGTDRGHQLWSARNSAGLCVGWLWITPIEGASRPSAFLEQITVASPFRRSGYGLAMLAALERLLASTGIEEVRLTVFAANTPARRLYASAGYRQLDDDGRHCRLCKRLTGPSAQG
ncbi:MAG: GNAT family N-acetyltransferase [Gaiellaceae bacterium]|jgi:ribosomal protein S18 acetylase RimI-like enzyme